MNFLKEANGDLDSRAIAFHHDLAFLAKDRSFHAPEFAKIMSFFEENRDCRELLLKYVDMKDASWQRAVDDAHEWFLKWSEECHRVKK